MKSSSPHPSATAIPSSTSGRSGERDLGEEKVPPPTESAGTPGAPPPGPAKPESAGTMGGQEEGGGRPFSPENKGAFREVRVITVRDIEIARKLAQSESLPPLEQMLRRIEALELLPVEQRRKHKISDAEVDRAQQIYGIAYAFLRKLERNEGGYAMVALPFNPRGEKEITDAFEGWVEARGTDKMVDPDFIGNLTPDAAAKLEVRFVTKLMPWIQLLSARVGDSINLSEWEAAAGKGLG